MSTTTYKMFIIKTLRLVPGATEVNDNRTRQGLQWSRLTLTKTIRRAWASSTRRVPPAACVKLHTAQHSRQRPEAGGGTKQALPTQRETQQKPSVCPSGRRQFYTTAAERSRPHHAQGPSAGTSSQSRTLPWRTLSHGRLRVSPSLPLSPVSARV